MINWPESLFKIVYAISPTALIFIFVKKAKNICSQPENSKLPDKIQKYIKIHKHTKDTKKNLKRVKKTFYLYFLGSKDGLNWKSFVDKLVNFPGFGNFAESARKFKLDLISLVRKTVLIESVTFNKNREFSASTNLMLLGSNKIVV